MANGVPHGKTLDADFMFTKLQVSDLDKAGAFYTAVFGLVEMHRIDAAIAGRGLQYERLDQLTVDILLGAR